MKKMEGIKAGERLYGVTRLITKMGVEASGLFNVKSEVLFQSDDGMIGCLPIFRTREQAEKDAGKKYKVFEVVVME